MTAYLKSFTPLRIALRPLRPFYIFLTSEQTHESLRLFWRLQTTFPLRVIIGTSGVGQDGWISTDQQQLDLLQPRRWYQFFFLRKADAILAEHVWEHLELHDGIRAAKTCYRYLKNGGHLRIAVPDGLSPNPKYVAEVKPHGSGQGADDHKVLYTWRTLKNVFEQAGFQVNLLEYFDETGRFQRHKWDPADGMIWRSAEYDERNVNSELHYTSIILDAYKSPKRNRK